MKKIFILSTLVALSVGASAQIKGNAMPNARQQQHFKKMAAFIRPASAVPAGKPTATRERVTAQVIRSGGFFDSVAYSYSGTRGSNFDYNNLELMYNYELEANYAPLPTLPGYTRSSDMLADSVLGLDNSGLYSVIVGTYRDDNKLDSFYELGWDKTLNTYDANAYLIEQNTYSIDANGDVTGDPFQRKISYNAGYTQVTGDSVFYSGTLERYTEYAYGTDDLIDTISEYMDVGSGIELRYRTLLGYDSEGRVESTIYEEHASGAVSYRIYDTLSYNGNSNDYISWITHYEEDDILTATDRVEKVLTGGGMIDSIYFFSVDHVEQEELNGFAVFEYTAMSNPSKITMYVDGLPLAISTIDFYYETYDDGQTGIDAAQGAFAFEVYPNPFTNSLNLSLGQDMVNQVMNVRLIDLQGRVVFAATSHPAQGNRKLQLPELPGGIYQLVLQDASGNTASRKLVKIH